MNSYAALQNKTILITRPESLAEPLLQRIKDAGGIAHHYPVIQIISTEDSPNLNSIINNLSRFDIAIFISPTSVQQTLDKVNSLPEKFQLAVIGKSTEAMLKKFGYTAQIVPELFNSESLLQHPSLQQDNILNKSIIIFRGIGGRDLLGDELTQRGAQITYAETYKRGKNPLPSLTTEELSNIDALAVTSNEGLQNLFDLTDNKSKLIELPIIVPGKRAQRLAEKLGFNKIIPATNATDDACLQALTNHFND